MKCARCGREMEKAAAWVGGHPFGPKCWEKMGDKPLKFRLVTVEKSDQLDLWGEHEGSRFRAMVEGVASEHSGRIPT